MSKNITKISNQLFLSYCILPIFPEFCFLLTKYAIHTNLKQEFHYLWFYKIYSESRNPIIHITKSDPHANALMTVILLNIYSSCVLSTFASLQTQKESANILLYILNVFRIFQIYQIFYHIRIFLFKLITQSNQNIICIIPLFFVFQFLR